MANKNSKRIARQARKQRAANRWAQLNRDAEKHKTTVKKTSTTMKY